ncbi:MAG TPA: hypothetical protein VGK75_10845, partial [Casimicrobiaceae bacterium]
MKPLPAAASGPASGRATTFFVLQQIKVAQASTAQATLLAPRLTPCLDTASLLEVLCGLQEGKGGRVRTP